MMLVFDIPWQACCCWLAGSHRKMSVPRPVFCRLCFNGLVGVGTIKALLLCQFQSWISYSLNLLKGEICLVFTYRLPHLNGFLRPEEWFRHGSGYGCVGVPFLAWGLLSFSRTVLTIEALLICLRSLSSRFFYCGENGIDALLEGAGGSPRENGSKRPPFFNHDFKNVKHLNIVRG